MVRLSQLTPAQKVALLVSVPATGVLLYFLLKNLMEGEFFSLGFTKLVIVWCYIVVHVTLPSVWFCVLD